jgi:hypothetical protein
MYSYYQGESSKVKAMKDTGTELNQWTVYSLPNKKTNK